MSHNFHKLLQLMVKMSDDRGRKVVYCIAVFGVCFREGINRFRASNPPG